MPWHCGFCSRWHPSRNQFCPTCGRPQKGRICRTCKNGVPGNAAYCPHCGGTSLSLPGGGGNRWRWQVRLGVLGLLALVAALLLPPLERSAAVLWHEGMHLVWRAVSFGIAFWVMTGLLPPPYGSILRKTARGILSLAGRLVAGLFKV